MMAQIFESPDGGKSIYSRLPHSTDRELIKQSSTSQLLDTLEHWMAIVAAADDNPALKNILDQAEMVYALTKKED